MMVMYAINKYSGGQLDGVTLPPNKARAVKYLAGTIFEATVYKIVGSDKYLRWSWLARFFERWH